MNALKAWLQADILPSIGDGNKHGPRGLYILATVAIILVECAL